MAESKRYLVDLLSGGPTIISQIPKNLLHLGQQSGRIILAEDDPNLTLLRLLGCECLLILTAQPVDKA